MIQQKSIFPLEFWGYIAIFEQIVKHFFKLLIAFFVGKICSCIGLRQNL